MRSQLPTTNAIAVEHELYPFVLDLNVPSVDLITISDKLRNILVVVLRYH